MWWRDSSRKSFYQWSSWQKWKAPRCKHTLSQNTTFSLSQGDIVALCQMTPARNWLCLVLTAARMRHAASIKHMPADKPPNFPISSLCLYFCTSKSTRSINGIAFGHSFPLEFAIQYQTIWLICRNQHKCLANIFLRLLIVNQDQRLVIALYYMFSSTSDENNITKEIFFF